ncbi:MAG: TetR/AcrR family transcriptional regulator [Bifidobacterium crudilactis]|jgi:AcrR family transcriptional regulator|nr:TetR/AcrR family transcriptional regulator [Bifidobacterium crudilactis]MCI1889430.1 TetR/AcrR family transcriptional regulator [Bifidobacterium crudilactis]
MSTVTVRQGSSRSRQALLDATIKLIEEREVPDITVTDIAAEAGVTRPTFYQNFQDLPTAFAAAALHRIRPVFENPLLSMIPREERMSIVDSFLRQITLVLEHYRDFYLKIFQGPAALRVLDELVEGVAEHMERESPVMGALQEGPLPFHEASHAVAAGTLWIIRKWLEHPDGLSAEDAAKQLRMFNTMSICGGLGSQVREQVSKPSERP